MKAYIIVQNIYDYCDNREVTLSYFSNKDVAEYVCAELVKNHSDKFNSFFTREVTIRENLFDAAEDLDRIYKEIKKNL